MLKVNEAILNFGWSCQPGAGGSRTGFHTRMAAITRSTSLAANPCLTNHQNLGGPSTSNLIIMTTRVWPYDRYSHLLDTRHRFGHDMVKNHISNFSDLYMASLQDQAAIVKAAVASIATCTPTTTVLLKELLLPSDPDTSLSSTSKTKTGSKPPRTAKSKQNGTAGTKKVGAGQEDKPELPAKERALLATHVINATLKSLSDAAKATPLATPQIHAAGEEDLVKTATKRRIRRSNSAPMTPMQPRSLNRVSTSPEVTKRPAPLVTSPSTGCLSTVECARVAFASLRSLQSAAKITLPELQLEAGMSSLVGKLISLNLIEHALKELRLLKRRLVDLTGTGQKKTTKAAPSVLSLAEVLDFQEVKASGQILNLVIATQVQVLRVMTTLKRPADTEASLPLIRMTNKSSPIALILSSAESSVAEKTRAARQLETVSQLLLALTPSISSGEDETATKPRLSVQPATALELQTIALQTRSCWWKLAGHKSDVDKDLLSPLAKCITAYVRRIQKIEHASYNACLVAFNNLLEQISARGLEPSKSSGSPLATIYQALGRMARESGCHADAVSWVEKLNELVDRSRDSAAKCLSTEALLLAHRLRMAWRYPSQDVLIQEVMDGLQGSLRGDSSELNDLLESLVMVRKSATYVLVGNVTDGEGNKFQPTKETAELLETFFIQMPRFCLRWLGKRPSSTENTKEILRYEQRRAVVAGSASQILDSALMLAKSVTDENRSIWEQLDPLLQDCVNLLDSLGDLDSVDPKHHYYAKISHLYYMQYTIFIAKEPKPTKTGTAFAHAVKALRRSIDCVKHRPRKERDKAQVLYKLERAIELYRISGRISHALEFLQTLRMILIEDGALTSVVQALKTMPLRQAWALNHDVQSLAWSIQLTARLEKVWIDWTAHLDQPERLAALEFGLDCMVSKQGTAIDPLDPCVAAVLEVCSAERYPVRRLGILLRLLMANVGNEARLEQLQAQVEEAASISEEANLSEDASLSGCIPHMKALSTSIIALARPLPDFEQLEKSMLVWRTILDNSTETSTLGDQIDDLPGLLEHLQSVADYARLSNRNKLLLKTLQLAEDLGRKSAELDPILQLQIAAALALQLTNLGRSKKAAVVFEQAQQIGTSSREETVRFLLSHAEYLIEIGNVEKADEVLHQAREAGSQIELSGRSRVHKLIIAHASLLYSAIALGRGDAPCALTHARNAARFLFTEWSRLEQQAAKESKSESLVSPDDSGTKLDVSLTEATEKGKDTTPKISGPEAWKLAHPVLQGLLFLSNTYAHLGMYQETVYYAEQARKVAQAAESEAYLAECDAWIASIWAKAGKIEDAQKIVAEVQPRLISGDYSSKLVGLCCQLCFIYREVRDFDSEKVVLEVAEAMVKGMGDGFESEEAVAKRKPATCFEKRTTKLAVREKSTVIARKTRAPAPKVSVASKKASTTKPTSVITITNAETEDAHLLSLKASVLVERASSMLHQKDWAGAWQLLQEARECGKLAANLLSELVATARSLLGQSMDQMAKDAVYSVIQESTLSFPAVNSTSNIDKVDRFSMVKVSPPGRVPISPTPPNTKAAPQGYLDNLREAREHLLEAHAMASVLGDGREVHRILCMLQTVVILLSAASSSSRKAGILGHPGYATCSVEMARNLTWRREYKALQSEKSSGRAGLEWPEEIRSSEIRRTSLSPVVDMTKFQREFIDILPQEWSVISISLSDNQHDLCISRLEASQNPFVIRLPLERATSRDADSEIFNFQHGRAELLDIIKRANATCHDKRDFSVKGAKTAWWAERSALDTQLKEFLEKIESVWLGGFKGIFSQHQKRPELLARFQTTFQTILDKHLPSRRQVRGKKTAKPATSKVALDTRILELFVGLGDASVEASDFDEMLNDLLYFVVDILQFHGERNAYDEIDFDTMVVETHDALHSYHVDANKREAAKVRNHTILVVDKSLHTFPWECLPCLEALAVSRVPSLACLRRLILEQQSLSRPTEETEGTEQTGHHVSADNGTYMLNPSGDLKNTQEIFEAPLSDSLSASWKRIHNKPPTEAEFEKALSSNDILLYMGHGGGAQYIRNRQIRRLPKCRATVLLMGCSSASLSDVGDFEVYGLVWSYMLAGCPAVVGTLWDVTDKDIDLYTGRLYEEWGLVKKGTFLAHLAKETKGKDHAKAKAAIDETIVGNNNKEGRSTSRKRAAAGAEGEKVRGREAVDGDGDGDGDTACEYGDASLPEAVARARNAGVCKFKYLNAGAVCVYGIPVYVDRSSERGGRERVKHAQEVKR